MVFSQHGLFMSPALVCIPSRSSVFPVTQFSLECHTNYHNNFSVQGGQRSYYAGKGPKYFQVGEHQYVEDKVTELWTGQMLLGWCVTQSCPLMFF